MSRFDTEGVFINSFAEAYSAGAPAVNSKGDVIRLTSGSELISLFDKAMQLRKKIFPADLHYRDSFLRAPTEKPEEASRTKLSLLMGTDDRLVVVSNTALKAYVFGPDLREIRRFDVADETLRKDIRKRYETQVKMLIEKGMNPPRVTIVPFTALLAPGGRLLLFTFDNKALVYSLDGRLEAVLQAPEGAAPARAVNNLGEIWSVTKDNAIVRFASPFQAKNN